MPFIKTHSAGNEALIQEARSLQALRDCIANHGIQGLSVPQVHSVDAGRLVLQNILQCTPSEAQWATLGRALAQLHRVHWPQWGWAEDNFIGLAPQCNTPCADWGTFFLHRRLLFQSRRIAQPERRDFAERVLKDAGAWLVDFLNAHTAHASLLHGDLWSGNVLFSDQDVWLIDPAVYCGDRSADVAMTALFGGFPAVFYRAYEAQYPLDETHPRKQIIYNLYHRLNHYNLFGESYWSGCRQGLQAIAQMAM